MKYKNKKTTKKSFPFVSILVFIVVLAVVVGGFLLLSKDDGSKESNEEAQSQTDNQRKINLEPPTEEEKQAGDAQKDKTADQDEAKLPENANVVIVDASQYENEIEVRAFVSNVIKDGTCTAKFSQGSVSFSEKVPAYADATTTPCIAIVVPRSKFKNPGDWQVSLTYSNGQIIGSSSAIIKVE